MLKQKKLITENNNMDNIKKHAEVKFSKNQIECMNNNNKKNSSER